MVSTTRRTSCATLVSRSGEPSLPWKYLLATMLVAVCDQSAGATTSRCSKMTAALVVGDAGRTRLPAHLVVRRLAPFQPRREIAGKRAPQHPEPPVLLICLFSHSNPRSAVPLSSPRRCRPHPSLSRICHSAPTSSGASRILSIPSAWVYEEGKKKGRGKFPGPALKNCEIFKCGRNSSRVPRAPLPQAPAESTFRTSREVNWFCMRRVAALMTRMTSSRSKG